MKNNVNLVGVVQRSFGTQTRGSNGSSWVETDFILAVKRSETSWDNIPIKVKNSVNLEKGDKVSVNGALRVDSWNSGTEKSPDWKSKTYVVTASVDKLSNEDFKSVASGSMA